MNPQTAYTQWSATYDTDRNLTRDLDQAVTQNLLKGQTYDTILEIGCGTGKNTVLLSKVARQVLALDFSEGMLGQAKQKVAASNVTFAMADLTQPWPCPNNWASFINCNLVLEHIRDLGPIFAEAGRALRPGGQFFISELHPFRQYGGTLANFKRGEDSTSIEAFIHHISDFIAAGQTNGLTFIRLQELWHAEDSGKPPRLAVFLFEKP